MWIYKFWKNMILSPFFSIPRCLKLTILRNIESFRYSHVHISSDEVFSKIMKKPSMMPHMKAKLIFIGIFFWKTKKPKKKTLKFSGKNIENWRSWKMTFFFCYLFQDIGFFKRKFSQWKSPWLSYEVTFISAVWIFFRILKKALSELICTRL